MSETKGNDKYGNIGYLFIWLGVAISGLYVIVLVYSKGVIINSSLPLNVDTMASIGNFLAGILGPIWALAGVMFYIDSLKLQWKEIEITKKQFEKQYNMDVIMRMINSLNMNFLWDKDFKEKLSRIAFIIDGILDNYFSKSDEERDSERTVFEHPDIINLKKYYNEHPDAINLSDVFKEEQISFVSKAEIIFKYIYIYSNQGKEDIRNIFFDYIGDVGITLYVVEALLNPTNSKRDRYLWIQNKWLRCFLRSI